MSKYPFKWFGFDTENPIGKFKQPQSNDDPIACMEPDGQGSGYPQTDIDKDGITVKGRWPAGTKTKSKMQMQGTGAATKGKNFYPDD